MNNVDKLSINTIRILSAEAVEKAQSGHPGMPMGAAPTAYTLWSKHMKHSPSNPNWSDRDDLSYQVGMRPCYCIHFYISLDMDLL